MPRKRKTRAAASRPHPKAPGGDAGTDLDIDLKKEKLKALVQDFDSEMATFFEQIREDLKDFEKSIELAFRVEVTKTPKYIRDMALEEFQSAGGELKSTELFGSQKITDDLTLSVESNISGMANLTKSKKKKTLKAVYEEGEEETRTVKRPAPRGRKKNTLTANTNGNMPPPPSTAKPSRRPTRQKAQFETPAFGGGPSMAGWETPLVTPKFDPRLPITPAMTRRPKSGEVLLSLAGSPISNNDKRSRLTVAKAPGNRKTTINVDGREIDLEDVKIPNTYEQATLDYMRLIRDKLNQIQLSPAQ